MPALPETVDSIRRVMLELSATIDEVLGILHRDPAVVAKVLSVANSPAYGFPGHVNDLEKAVALMGLREVYAIVLSASYMDRSHAKSSFDYRRFWIDSMTCADLAKRAAELTGHEDVAGAYWAGYLHDVGRIVLLTVAQDLYNTLPEGVEGADLVVAEEELFGLAHTEAGFELAVDWNLPLDIAEAIRFHHAPERAAASKDTVATVALAEALLHKSTEPLEDRCACCLNILDVSRARRKTFFRSMGDVAALRRHWASQWRTAFTAHPRHN